MKHPSKREKRRMLAERLLDGIGDVNDVYLEEARTYCPEPVRHFRKRWIAIPATVLSALLVFVLVRQAMFRPSVLPDQPITDVEAADQLIEAVIQQDHFSVCTPQELTFHTSGGASEARLIIAKRSSGQLHVSRLFRMEEARQLASSLVSGGRKLSPEEAHSAYAVWVVFGDGRVISPDIRMSEGNIGFGQLFSYVSEQLASPSFYEFLDRLLQDGS